MPMDMETMQKFLFPSKPNFSIGEERVESVAMLFDRIV